MYVHNPVMLEQVLRSLEIRPSDRVVDCTLGEGGHARHFLEKLTSGTLLGIEQDDEILKRARERLASFDGKFIPVHDNFSNLKAIIEDNFSGGIDKIFFDLGISMYHIRESGRGFSFSGDEPLDMRLDRTKAFSAADVVNRFSRKKLSEIIWAYGEERFSGRIALYIVEAREKKRITSSVELADIVKKAVPGKYWPKKIHPATKTFQAIRIFVNDEIELLENSLRDAVDALKPCGRITVISFHSLEDRIVKSVFNDLKRDCRCPPEFPVCVCGGKRIIKVLTKKPLVPDERETEQNPSSRSARLRCAEKLDGANHESQKEMRYSA